MTDVSIDEKRDESKEPLRPDPRPPEPPTAPDPELISYSPGRLPREGKFFP